MEENNPVEKYLATFETKSTRKGHRSHLNQFFKIIEAEPKTYFQSNRNYEEDVIKLWYSMSAYAPGSRKIRMSVVVNFLLDNNVQLKPRLLKSLKGRTKTVEKITDDVIPDKQELRKILSHGAAKERALFLLSISSGMRIDEILQLTLRDIDFKSNPVKITVRAEIAKNKKPRITFMSNETHDALDEWLKIRDNYLCTATKRAVNLRYHKDANDNRIFPFDYQTARLMWCRILHEAELDGKDSVGHYKIHIHSLRKFFRTFLPNGDHAISNDVVETLMGHEGYLTQSYRRIPEDQLAKEYLKALSTVTIFGINESIVEDKDLQIATLKQQMETMKNDIVNQVLNTLKSGQPQLIKELMKQTPTAQVYADGSTEL